MERKVFSLRFESAMPGPIFDRDAMFGGFACFRLESVKNALILLPPSRFLFQPNSGR